MYYTENWAEKMALRWSRCPHRSPVSLLQALSGDFIELVEAQGWFKTMAKSGKTHQGQAVQWKGFVKGKLQPEEREAAEQCYLEDRELFELIGGLVFGRYKISLAHDAAHNCVMATLFCQAEVAWKGFSLTARGKDWRQALQFLLYRHVNVLGEDWTDYIQDDGGDYLG